MKKLLKQLKGYLLIKMSIYTGIGDFSKNPEWDRNESLWKNAYNLFVKGKGK